MHPIIFWLGLAVAATVMTGVMIQEFKWYLEQEKRSRRIKDLRHKIYGEG